MARPNTKNEGAGLQRQYLKKHLATIKPRKARAIIDDLPAITYQEVKAAWFKIAEALYNQGQADAKANVEFFLGTEPQRTKKKGGLGRK